MMLTRFANRTLQRANARLEKQVAELQSELEAERLKTAVIEAERDNLAQVVARDRERIKAEGAAYARQRAEAEGVNHDGTEDSVRRFSA